MQVEWVFNDVRRGLDAFEKLLTLELKVFCGVISKWICGWLQIEGGIELVSVK
jgi:hypothetical protein